MAQFNVRAQSIDPTTGEVTSAPRDEVIDTETNSLFTGLVSPWSIEDAYAAFWNRLNFSWEREGLPEGKEKVVVLSVTEVLPALEEVLEPANTFVEQVTSAGYEVEPYHGRFYWFGPAVRASSIEEYTEVARQTSVRLNWDSPLVYPDASDQKWYDWAIAHPENFRSSDEDEEDLD